MLRRLAIVATLSGLPGIAFAEDTMPQMDFHNPLTATQIIWMIVILIGLYLTLSNWALPSVAKVLETRAQMISRDLEAARSAKQAADSAIRDLTHAINHARNAAQAEIADAVAAAKTQAAKDAAVLTAQLDEKLAKAEAQVQAARNAALQAIQPVAQDAVQAMVNRLTGRQVDQASIQPLVRQAADAAGIN